MQQSVGAPMKCICSKDLVGFQNFYSKINEREKLWQTEPGDCNHVLLVAPLKIQCV